MFQLKTKITSAPSRAFLRDGVVAFVAGAVLGVAAGLIGVGGGEFRIPALLYLLRLEVKTAAGVNLIVGFFTVSLAFFRRWGQQEWPTEDLLLAGVLVTVSIIGAVVGARYAHRLPSRPLKKIVLAYLLIVGVWMITEAITGTETAWWRLEGVARLLLAAAVGFLIAAVSGSLGVAGGEMRIPALMYLFSYGLKEAGTISLLASIPTVGAGALSYRRMGHIPNRVLTVAFFMAAGSLLGVLLGTSLLPFVNKHLLKGLLGVILLVATVCLALPAFLAGRGNKAS